MSFQHSLRSKLALSALVASVLIFAPTQSLAAASSNAACTGTTVTVRRIDTKSASTSALNASCDTYGAYGNADCAYGTPGCQSGFADCAYADCGAYGNADCAYGTTGCQNGVAPCTSFARCTSPETCGPLRCSGAACSTICVRRGECTCDAQTCQAADCQALRACAAAQCGTPSCGDVLADRATAACPASRSPRNAPADCPAINPCPSATPCASVAPTQAPTIAPTLPVITPAPAASATVTIAPTETVSPEEATATPTVAPTAAPTATPTLEPVIPTVAPTVVPSPTPTDAHYTRNDYAAQEQELLSYVNEDRVKDGLAPLTWNEKLADTARVKSQDMADNGYFDHNSPTLGGMKDLLAKMGIRYSAAGENIAHYGSIIKAHAALMSSEGHYRNIMSTSFTQIGIGITTDGRGGYLITEEFLRP